VRDDSFCVFIFYEKHVKISGIGRMGGLVANQLTQLTTNAIKIK
jgi:hypothetical protein